MTELLITAALLTAAVVTLAALKNRLFLKYSPRRDYTYRFGPQTKSWTQTLTSGGSFTWTSDDITTTGDRQKTLLVRAEIRGNLLSLWQGVRVELYLNDRLAVTQTFESQTNGQRYLNLSKIAGEVRHGDVLRLELKRGHLGSAAIELFEFLSPVPENRRVLIIAPHPDDAEVAAFGIYSSIKEACVVTVTAGDNGYTLLRNVVPDEHARSIRTGITRVWDSLLVPLIGRVSQQRIYNLGYFDGTLARMYNTPRDDVISPATGLTSIETFRSLNYNALPDHGGANRWSSLVQDLAYLIEQHRPEVIVTPHPFFDSLGDHQFSTRAVAEAVASLTGTQARPESYLLYTNHATHTETYPFGAIDDEITLPPWFEPGVPAGAIYSRPLSEQARIEKLIALESMHDLRLVDFSAVEGLQARLTVAGLWLKLTLRDLGNFGKGYFRRAARRNELFFAYDAAQFESLIRQHKAVSQ